MYSKEESKILRQKFWTAFDNYTHLFSRKKGFPVKWMLYKTGIKGMELKFDLSTKSIEVALELNHKNEERQFDMLVMLDNYKNIINEGFINQSLIWDDKYKLETGKTVTRIYCIKEGVKFHNQDHWPAIFKFMANQMWQLQTNLNEVLPILKNTFGR